MGCLPELALRFKNLDLSHKISHFWQREKERERKERRERREREEERIKRLHWIYIS
jgi:hypothetical protein